jgi:hypothetical protein
MGRELLDGSRKWLALSSSVAYKLSGIAYSHRDTANNSNVMKLFAIDQRHEAVVDNINVCDKLSTPIPNSEVQNRHSIGWRKKNIVLDSQTVERRWRNFIFQFFLVEVIRCIDDIVGNHTSSRSSSIPEKRSIPCSTESLDLNPVAE